jgi:phosphatidylserine decarboxylase
MEESQLRLEEFTSFNDFFTRRLRPECRPQAIGDDVVTIPADGRYRVIQDIDNSDLFSVKGKKYSLAALLGCHEMAALFHGGTAVFGRLCPADCHRFYFPMSGKVHTTSLIHGSLFSVSPLAFSGRPWILWNNRRAVTLLETEHAGAVAILEIGATNCGSIVQTYPQNSWVRKGQEKGYFRIGGSAVILLFEPGRIAIEQDLLELSASGYEVLCRTGQLLATVCS